jgi:methyl acetate hydrolase
MMFTPQIGDIALPEVMGTNDPALANDVPSLPFRQTWGLGLHLFVEDLPGMRRSGSGDWAGLLNSYYWIDRQAGVTGTFFTQVLPFFDAATVRVPAALEQEVYAGLGAAAAT